MPLPPERLQNGVRSGMILGSKLQYLASTPEEVRDELIAKGGDALPVPAAFESLPGPGRARTSNQTVMSRRL